MEAFHPAVQSWFRETFAEPTEAQLRGWEPIVRGESMLLLAPTGSGKTLAAFLAAIDRLSFSAEPEPAERLRVLYVSPLKALGVDVERNLEAPLAGVRRVAARDGHACRELRVAVRSGDTPARERTRFAKEPPDILITTPESLYLLLTSEARHRLASVETVIVDEIHSLAPTKRGAHLFLSLERLEALRRSERPLQRIGLSATQRPLTTVARLLGGHDRPVTIVDAGTQRRIDVRVEMPARGEQAEGRDTSSWPAIHQRLVELVREHRSTMIFVNSRRLAERLSTALNDVAGEELSLAHHGSVAKDRRLEIETRLKRGELPAIVATSSLELGIDMGAVDLVVQVEAPPSVASGLQRIGRAGHSVGEVSRGVIFPKHPADLLAAASAARRMLDARVESTAFPESPLDVLAQQIVAMVALEDWDADALFETVRRAAPFAELSRSSFEAVLDLLGGRYASELGDLRPRITWDRGTGRLSARAGARRIAVLSGGTIPDRGLYGVFLLGESERGVRVGELDEEMVFESRVGDVFLLGASSWRIQDITHDRVIVTPAPGEPGKMPFWHGDRPSRAAELGLAIGELTRSLAEASEAKATRMLEEAHALHPSASAELVRYVREQLAATGEVPSDRALVVERFVDESGDWRVCLLSPFGSRVHAPLAMALTASGEAEAIWTDDGIVLRFPRSDRAPEIVLPSADEIESRLLQTLGKTSLFAARFRENAARALLLPRRFPGRRSPLWAQRRRAADLLAVASRHPSFPILLETYRECLKDEFDMPALEELLRGVEQRKIRVVTVDSPGPSPFAASLLFSYVGNYIYQGDAPLAERRAQALSIDLAELRTLVGRVELSALLDEDVVATEERRLLRLDAPIASADALHDLLLALGPISLEALAGRGALGMDDLVGARRAIVLDIAGASHLAAVEDAARLRDALGVALPESLPAALLEPASNALPELIARHARTHVPFGTDDVSRAFGIDRARALDALGTLEQTGRIVRVESDLWSDPEVLQLLKRRSLAKLRRQIEPVAPSVLAKFLVEWQGVGGARSEPDALFAVVGQLEGAPLVASTLESDLLPARLAKYRRSDLDHACASGRVVWRGLEPLGQGDGRIALYSRERYRLLAPPPSVAEGELAARIRDHLERRGACFFADLAAALGAFSADLHDALWKLVWSGEITNDTFEPLRALCQPAKKHGRRTRERPQTPGGRWSLLPRPRDDDWPNETERRAALTRALLERHGVVTREAVQAEGIAGGFSAVYDVLKTLEDSGRVRRGYFVDALAATQFASSGADERLRAVRDSREPSEPVLLAATDPANAWGAALPWPESASPVGRSAGARVVLFEGELIGWLSRGDRALVTFASGRPDATAALARALAQPVESGERRATLIATIDGDKADRSPLAPALVREGFVATQRGLFKRPARAEDVRGRSRRGLSPARDRRSP